MSLCCLLAVLMVSACGSSEATPTPEPTILSKPLATLAPTNTPSEADIQATQEALRSRPTIVLPTMTLTATPYVGVFIGEADLEDPGRPISESSQFAATPRRGEQGLPIVCETTPDPVFGTNWTDEPSVLDGLGCPIQISFNFRGRVQVFEHGAMYLRSDTSEVWAIAPGTLSTTGHYWYVEQPPSLTPQGVSPPSGLRVPEGAIGSVWYAYFEVRSAIGFASTADQETSITLQRFEGGSMLFDRSSGQVFALLINGDAYGPY